MNVLETPINASLQALQDVAHWHCLPRTRAAFRDFSSETRDIETTSTRELGSLLANTGAIQTSQALAARAYGSDMCRFSTGGTTQANHVVSAAYLSPGD